ncbi:protein CMSS1 [Syngnathoides biaculeatus]|uniref:protein CMSS1 n=1 Tax=Syngnathoides biaculeatus TaxID=300417 RepID=UPI002ADE20D0|nr:protein CMSS1 [Syngnathoides biaculeatus]
MGDDLGDEWWLQDVKSDASDVEDEKKKSKTKQIEETPSVQKKAEKRKTLTEKIATPKKKKTTEKVSKIPKQRRETETSTTSPKKRKRKKKTITDVLAASDPKPGCPADLQNSLAQYFSDKRSVIEQEELKLHDSSFVACNDLTHSLSSYLKHICPKWAKIQKQHTEKRSVVLLIVCSSALRAIDLIRQLTTFKGEAKAVKLFAKHIKIEEQVKLLQKGVVHIGVGTPARIGALIHGDGLNLQALRFLVLDWNWRDQKCRRMMDIPEIKLDFIKMFESWILDRCKADQVKIGLF